MYSIIIYIIHIHNLVEELNKKWKNTRDNYTRDVNESRRIVSGPEAPKKNKKYAYADVLSFLRPIVKKKKVSI